MRSNEPGLPLRLQSCPLLGWFVELRSLPAMLIIRLFTSIAAPLECVFDLARSIDAHQQSAEGTHELGGDLITHQPCKG